MSVLDSKYLASLIKMMLFCKPSRKSGILYEQQIERGQTLAIRSLKISQDLPVIYQWAGGNYWPQFWPLPPALENPVDILQFVQKSPHTHAFVGLLDEQLICQIDLCSAAANDICKHISVSPHDCMIRFLWCPLLAIQPAILSAFLRWYFQFPQAGDLLAEPDITNHQICRELETIGFVFHRNAMLAKKAASIYVMNRKRFQLLELIIQGD